MPHQLSRESFFSLFVSSRLKTRAPEGQNEHAFSSEPFAFWVLLRVVQQVLV
ncbi:hypothetical protein ACJA3G_07880 [Streptomyces sp. YS-3]